MLIEKYTTTWIRNFEDIKRQIGIGLQDLEISIEHIGSTSVPNLDAKPIIDIDIVYNNRKDFDNIKKGLLQIGYYHNGNQGIQDRDVFKRNGKHSDEILDCIKHHLYVCLQDSKALERHILSRNYLRNNDWARIEYQQMKYDLAERANQDQKIYAELKELNVNGFIDLIIEKEKSIHI